MSCLLEGCDCVSCQLKRGRVFSYEEMIALLEEDKGWKIGKYPILNESCTKVEFPIGSRFYCRLDNFKASVLEVVEAPNLNCENDYETLVCEKMCDLYRLCSDFPINITCDGNFRVDMKNVYFKVVNDDD